MDHNRFTQEKLNLVLRKQTEGGPSHVKGADGSGPLGAGGPVSRPNGVYNKDLAGGVRDQADDARKGRVR